MRNLKVYYVCMAIAATIAGAVWLYTYSTWEVLEYIDRNGHRFHASERVRIQPWWSVYATVGLLFVGAGVTLWLLPECRRVLERVSARLVKQPRSASRAPR